MSNVQTYHRRQDENPYHCVFCGQKICDFTEEDLGRSYCEHVTYVAHTEGNLYLAPRSIELLKGKGFEVEADGDYIEVSCDDEEVDDYAADVTEAIDFKGTLKIVDEVGPPSMEQTYIGLAPI